jgi:hypothetical protein
MNYRQEEYLLNLDSEKLKEHTYFFQSLKELLALGWIKHRASSDKGLCLYGGLGALGLATEGNWNKYSLEDIGYVVKQGYMSQVLMLVGLQRIQIRQQEVEDHIQDFSEYDTIMDYNDSPERKLNDILTLIDELLV